jgi:hypothetical protein
MSEWNFMSHDSKDTLLRVVRQDAEAFFAMVSQPEVWSGTWSTPLKRIS